MTNSVEAFHEMASGVDAKKQCVQLYKSYLETFEINLEQKNAD